VARRHTWRHELADSGGELVHNSRLQAIAHQGVHQVLILPHLQEALAIQLRRLESVNVKVFGREEGAGPLDHIVTRPVHHLFFFVCSVTMGSGCFQALERISHLKS